MRVVVFQPPYPADGTISGAATCLGWMQSRLDRLAPGQHDLVLLPEYATAPGLSNPQLLRECATSLGLDFLRRVASSSERLRSLIALSAPVQVDSSWYNRTLVYGPQGNLAFTYDKVHLTDVETHDLLILPGTIASVHQHAGTRFGFATCFDLYFPEHFEALAAQSADIVLCPSYQRSESSERISLIARARALDSGTYVIRSSYALGNAATGGRSLVATPEGNLLADAGGDACVIAVELDPGRKFVKPASHGRPLVEHRSLIESHRRPEAYRSD